MFPRLLGEKIIVMLRYRVVRSAMLAALLCCLALFSTALCSHAETNYRVIAFELVRQFQTDRDVSGLNEKTVAVMPFRNRSTDENVDPMALHSSLQTALIKAKLMTVIERDRIDRAMSELKLQTTGLIDQASQKKLGQFLGADYLLIGTISGAGTRLTVDASLLEVETLKLISAAEYTGQPVPPDDDDHGEDVERAPVELLSWDSTVWTVSSLAETQAAAKRDAVCWLVEDRIFGKAKDIFKRWEPEISAKLYADPASYIDEVIVRQDAYYLKVNYAQVYRDLVSIIFGKITPRICVDTRETIIRRPVPDPAVQTTLEAALLKYGFQVMDSSQVKTAQLREALRQANGSNDPRALNLLREACGELQADIAVIGDSFAEERQARDGFDARVEYKFVDCVNGRVLASEQSTASLTSAERPEVDPASAVAAKLALQRAAEMTAVRMSADFLKAFGQPIYTIRVWKIDSDDEFKAIANHLKMQLPGATVAQRLLDLRMAHTAIIEVSTKRDFDAVSQALKSVPGARIRVTEFQCRSIVCELY
ncbi:MAG: CsgG/HfaB family protein [Armatimonadota bacterium]